MFNKISSWIDRLEKFGRKSYSFESECYRIVNYIYWAHKYKHITKEESDTLSTRMTNIIRGDY